MPTIDDTLRSGDDSSRISSGRDQASAARSRPLPPGLPAQHTPPKKAAAEADYAGFFGLSASARCRRARRNFATIAGGASKPTARRPLSIGIRAPIGLDIGAATPAEIALAILAEIVQALRRPEPA